MSLPGIFVVGTDTGVGKTHVATSVVQALRSEGRRVGVLKPVSTGSIPSEDALRLAEALGADVPIERIAPIMYEEPLAPTIAARRAGTPLTQAHLNAVVEDALAWWSDRSEVMVVEGIGGLLCPLAEGSTVADLAIMLDYPLLIVARRGLGTINHTLLTIEAARLRSLRIAGLVLNSPEPESDGLAEATCADELAPQLPGVALLAELGHVPGNMSGIPEPLAALDWFLLARPPRRISNETPAGTGLGEGVPAEPASEARQERPPKFSLALPNSARPSAPGDREQAPSFEEADDPCLAT